MAARAKIENTDKPEDDEFRVSAEDLMAALEEINSLKREAAEASGAAGKATSEVVKKFGCEKNALTFTARLAAMESTKRNSVITNLLSFVITAGWLDEMDMFLREQMVELIRRTDNSKAA
jgi:uncharacterized tellurite resistance protein B-like protein